MKKRLIYTIAIGLLVSLSISGCSKDPFAKLSKGELVRLANQNTATIEDNEVRIDELETLLRGIQEEDGPTASISTIDDGTGRLTFNSIDGKIVFPTPFEYPGSTQAANTSSINITKTISVAPTKNWTAVLNGTTLELNHTNGVTGLIKAGAINEMYDRDQMQTEIMGKFFEGFPPEKITYSKLFLDDQCWGIEAKLATTIDSQPSYLRCGMLGLGEESFVYMFVYEGDKDAGKDETITSLLKTMTMLGQSLRVE